MPMADASQNAVFIRQIQGLAALFSCLPRSGKARQFFSLALDLDEGPALEKIGPPSDPASDQGMREWFESLWAEGGISADEQRLVDWQKDPNNMTAAVAEFRTVAEKLGTG